MKTDTMKTNAKSYLKGFLTAVSIGALIGAGYGGVVTVFSGSGEVFNPIAPSSGNQGITGGMTVSSSMSAFGVRIMDDTAVSGIERAIVGDPGYDLVIRPETGRTISLTNEDWTGGVDVSPASLAIYGPAGGQLNFNAAGVSVASPLVLGVHPVNVEFVSDGAITAGDVVIISTAAATRVKTAPTTLNDATFGDTIVGVAQETVADATGLKVCIYGPSAVATGLTGSDTIGVHYGRSTTTAGYVQRVSSGATVGWLVGGTGPVSLFVDPGFVMLAVTGPSLLTGSVTADLFGATGGLTVEVGASTITVTGATAGKPCSMGIPTGATMDSSYFCKVTAANTATVYRSCANGEAVGVANACANDGSLVWEAAVIQ